MATAASGVKEIQVNQQVNDFVKQPRRMLIGGQWVEAASGKTFPAHNPATGEVLGYAPEGEAEDINRAVKAARKAFESGAWPNTTTAERERLINKLADLIEKNG